MQSIIIHSRKGFNQQMSKKIFSLLLVATLAVSLFGCRQIDDSPALGNTSSKSDSSDLSAVSSESLPAKDPVSIKLVAAGDNLIHNGIYDQARARAGGSGYDFNYAYQNVKSLINGDINVLNQETLLVAPTFAPSNYPLFSTPVEVGDLMIEMGFNVFTLANNHMLDKGAKGIQTSLEYFDKQKEKASSLPGSSAIRRNWTKSAPLQKRMLPSVSYQSPNTPTD